MCACESVCKRVCVWYVSVLRECMCACVRVYVCVCGVYECESLYVRVCDVCVCVCVRARVCVCVPLTQQTDRPTDKQHCKQTDRYT